MLEEPCAGVCGRNSDRGRDAGKLYISLNISLFFFLFKLFLLPPFSLFLFIFIYSILLCARM